MMVKTYIKNLFYIGLITSSPISTDFFQFAVIISNARDSLLPEATAALNTFGAVVPFAPQSGLRNHNIFMRPRAFK